MTLLKWIHIEEKKPLENFINKIIEGDCLEVMKTMPNECVDLVLTDPPFDTTQKEYELNLTLEQYQQWFSKVIDSIYMLLSNNGFLVLESSIKRLGIFYNIPSKKLRYVSQIIAYCNNNMRQGAVGYSNYSPFLIFTKGKKNAVKPYRDVIEYSLVSNKNEFTHPSPKSIEVYEKLIKMFSEENNLVLDPFLGSGTTAIASKRMRRQFIGIELNPEYIELSRRRLRTYEGQKLLIA